MDNFSYQNPVRVVFGKGSIAELKDLVPAKVRILMTYGGGSIKANGVYAQVKKALKGRALLEFGGIEPNPRYETLMNAVALARKKKVGFLLAVGGGSVLDGTKFIAAAIPFKGGDPWKILSAGAEVKSAVPLGSVLTLPATGSEMNTFAVISRNSTNEKLAFGSPHCYPQFAVLDPVATFSLPLRQVQNGVVDAFAHVCEQYMTYDTHAPLQARQAEAILMTLLEEGPKTVKRPKDYTARANLMWCATMALNGLISVGVPQDWTTHMIGHEITALYGLDHAQTLAVVLPGVLANQKARKCGRLAQCAERVFGVKSGSPAQRADACIRKIEGFYRSLGVKTRLSEYGIDADKCAAQVSERLKARAPYGEHGAIGPKEIAALLRSRA